MKYLCWLAFVGLALLSLATPTWAQGKRPNILFIVTDDQRADTIGALGNAVVKTPNIDKIANRGFAFRNAYCMGSTMGAVAGILVGLYYGAIFPSMGFIPGLKAFVAMVMGGLSSIPGAVICALILGVSESFATIFMPSVWSDMVAYGFLILTLVFFPRGIFGGARDRV